MRSKIFWNKAYDVLVQECCADERDFARSEFVREMTSKEPTPEYRFCGCLGFGGKFRRQDSRLYVDCYNEDMTPSRKLSIDAANARLDRLARSPLKRWIEERMGVT